ncbi:serine/threonine/tyrosine protein kinase MPS1 [Rhodotorula paludigena]|uniref:serine/threonine/tyrosine protein kinase MPS1 n=1 Tax=Rhodotorula paludigena TaxID=86838 RepID=UPI0031759BD7
MSGQPSTPSTSKGSNAFGKLLNKLRSPTGDTASDGAGAGGASTPRSASPFSAMLGRRSSSKASVRSYASSTHDRAPIPPFPSSLNGSASSLSAGPSPPSYALETDDDLDLPQFESERLAYPGRGGAGAGSGAASLYSHPLASTSTLASNSAATADSAAPFADYSIPPRPSTSMSTRSRTGSTADSLSGSGGGGWKSALLGSGSRDAAGSLGRGFGKSVFGRSKENVAAQGDDEDDELTHKVPSKQDELGALPAPRAPLTRLPSTDSTLSASQPAASSQAHLASTTPGLARPGLSKSTNSAQPSAGTRRLFASRSTGGDRVVGRARRVVQPAQPPSAGTPDGPAGSDAYDGDSSASAKDDSPLGLSGAAASRETSPEIAPPPVRARPPISPNAHGRSRSELPPSSPKIASAERASSTVTIGSSTYQPRHGLAASGATRPASSLGYHSTSDQADASPPSLGAGGSCQLGSSRGYLQASASQYQQPQGSTAFRNRFLSSASNLSLSSSSAHNSPDLASGSASSTSNASPPMLSSSLSTSTSSTSVQSVNGAAPFKLAPMGAALSRKNSVSMLASLAEDPRPPISAAARAASFDSRRAEPAPLAPRASLDEQQQQRRASPPREMMVPYAHRRGSSISRGASAGEAMETVGTSSSSSSTHGGTTLVNGSSGLGGHKRTNSETITQSSLMARPGSSTAVYRDEPQQARPQVARVPSSQLQHQQQQYQAPSVVDVHPDPQPPAFQPYHDENAYDARSANSYARHAPPPSAPPQHALPPQPQQQPQAPSTAQRPVLAEINRGYMSSAPGLPQQQPPSTQPRAGAPVYQKDYQVPLRDRSPGIAEATPSVTVQQQHYQSHQAYQHQQQHQQQQFVQQQMVPPHVQMVGYTPGTEHAAEKRQPKPIMVNGKAYHRAGILGRGGSSKVYRVMSASNELLALKKVDTRNDAESRASFINEITLLRKLEGKPEIIQLIDSEVQGKYVIMVMEAGETDLNSLLASHAGKPVSLNFIRYIWEQMLSAVQVIHDEAVVHSDLKPANFVLVKGRLKLIDFGISKAIAADTTNIGREQQIGTANYMPPEALNDTGLGQGGKRLMKFGRAADVWSLGCILYQMVYGGAPFSHLRDLALKVAAIANPRHRIAFPDHAVPTGRRGEPLTEHRFKVGPDLLDTLKSCLRYDSKERATIPELLMQPFLRRSGDEAAPAPSSSRYPCINDQMMEAVIKCVADKVAKGEVRSDLDIVDIASGLMKQVRDIQDTLQR